jgi:hypothetical protein
MDWNNIEKKYNHFNEDWSHYPEQFCKDEIKPSYKELFENVQETKNDKWFESMHPFCKSCYSTYKNVCQQIGISLNLGSNWKKDDLPNAVDDFILDMQNYPEDHRHSMYEKLLHNFVDCISARWFQHDNCFITTNRKINTNVELSDINHIHFLVILCREAKKIYSIYKTIIYTKNMIIEIKRRKSTRSMPLILDIFKKDNPQFINICRNILKNYGSFKDKEDIDDIFKSDDKLIRYKKAISSIRNEKSKKQSRNKNAYKISGKTMKSILKRHFNID